MLDSNVLIFDKKNKNFKDPASLISLKNKKYSENNETLGNNKNRYWWTTTDVKNFREYLFVYGDNDLQYGKGGQAIIRDEDNTFGIPVKKKPTTSEDAYYTDDEFTDNVKKIDKSVSELYKLMSKKTYTNIVFPYDGIGTGLAKLSTLAPKTFEYLNLILNKYFGIIYDYTEKSFVIKKKKVIKKVSSKAKLSKK